MADVVAVDIEEEVAEVGVDNAKSSWKEMLKVTAEAEAVAEVLLELVLEERVVEAWVLVELLLEVRVT